MLKIPAAPFACIKIWVSKSRKESHDETMINVRKTEPIDGENYSWAWNLLDHETRFLIASEVTKHRNIEDARKVFQEAKQTANGQTPDFIITDRLPAYKQAITKEFYTMKKPRTQHVKLKNIREGTNNNVVERLMVRLRRERKLCVDWILMKVRRE